MIALCWLCWFLIYNRVTYKYTYIPSLLYFPPTPSFPPFKVITEHQAELPVLNSSFPLSIYLTYGEMFVCVCVCVCIYIYIYIYMSIILSQFAPPYFPRCFLNVCTNNKIMSEIQLIVATPGPF